MIVAFLLSTVASKVRPILILFSNRWWPRRSNAGYACS